MRCVTSGSVSSGLISSSVTVDNAGALDGVGRADEILRAEVDDIGIELATGAVLEDGCGLTFWCFFQISVLR